MKTRLFYKACATNSIYPYYDYVLITDSKTDPASCQVVNITEYSIHKETKTKIIYHRFKTIKSLAKAMYTNKDYKVIEGVDL